MKTQVSWKKEMIDWGEKCLERGGLILIPRGKQFWGLAWAAFELEIGGVSGAEGALQCWRISDVDEGVWISIDKKEYIQQRPS